MPTLNVPEYHPDMLKPRDPTPPDVLTLIRLLAQATSQAEQMYRAAVGDDPFGADALDTMRRNLESMWREACLLDPHYIGSREYPKPSDYR